MEVIRAGDITGFDDAEILEIEEKIAPVQPGAENQEDQEEKESVH